MKQQAFITITSMSQNGICAQPRTVSVEKGHLLSQILYGQGHGVSSPCGGRKQCGKCRVKATGALSPVAAQETAALSVKELENGWRLACCTRVLGPAEVWVTAMPEMGEICTAVSSVLIPEEPLFTSYGAVVDIGTTTLAAQLYGKSGLLAQASAINPQQHYGADVISRMTVSMEGEGEALALCIQGAVSILLQELAQSAKIPVQAVDTVVITGNTAMLYFFIQRSPVSLSHAPFHADDLFGRFMAANALQLPCAETAMVYFPPCISAFVGADITTALLATGLCNTKETALLVDIGTNGEMALWHQNKLLCCATAAGPAFEGAGLSMGMAGATGAIERVWYSAEKGCMEVQVIGNAPANGICGSGVVDALAALLQAGGLAESGALCAPWAVQAACGETAVSLTPQVHITQKDIRQVQLAKSAICAGLHTLLYTASGSEHSLTRLAIAGGFGSFLSLPSAAAIGLIPAALLEKAQVVGNAALQGAAQILCNKTLIAKAQALAQSAALVDLSTNPIFAEQYMECMMF